MRFNRYFPAVDNETNEEFVCGSGSGNGNGNGSGDQQQTSSGALKSTIFRDQVPQNSGENYDCDGDDEISESEESPLWNSLSQAYFDEISQNYK